LRLHGGGRCGGVPLAIWPGSSESLGCGDHLQRRVSGYELPGLQSCSPTTSLTTCGSTSSGRRPAILRGPLSGRGDMVRTGRSKRRLRSYHSSVPMTPNLKTWVVRKGCLETVREPDAGQLW
jgi:hypothetical protein